MSFSLKAAVEEVDRKFGLYKAMAKALAMGQIQHMIVHGPPGIGKTHELEEVLTTFERLDKITYHRAAGHVTALSLYNMLFENKGQDQVVVFDDCDEVFKSPLAMNILKAATDTRPTRTLSWESTGGKPSANRFDYEGRIAVLTNADLGKNQHLQALVDRMFYVPLHLNLNERVARIVSVLTKPEDGRQPHPKADEVAGWIITNHLELGERLTIRTAVKACELASFETNWQPLAKLTIAGT